MTPNSQDYGRAARRYRFGRDWCVSLREKAEHALVEPYLGGTHDRVPWCWLARGGTYPGINCELMQ